MCCLKHLSLCYMSEPLKLVVIISYFVFKEGNCLSNLHLLIMKAVF